METVARVRRAYFVQEKSIKEIARDLKVSRKTVRKVIRSGATSFHYARGTQPAPKLGPWRDALDGLLLNNAGKSARERLTLMRLFEALRGLGYEGGYDAVRRYARTWRRERSAMTADAYVPLSFAPGEAYQFDWSHEVVLIDGVTVKIKVAHIRLCHSRMPFVRAYPRESQEMVFDAHDRAFAFFKGACRPRRATSSFSSSSAAIPGPTWRASTSCRSNRRSSVIWRSCESGVVLAPRGGAGSISSRRTLKRAKRSRLGLRVSSARATGRAWARPPNLPTKGRGCEGRAGAGWRVWTCAWQPLWRGPRKHRSRRLRPLRRPRGRSGALSS